MDKPEFITDEKWADWCVAIKRPESGIDELDAMINRSRRDDFARAALQGMLAAEYSEDWSHKDTAETALNTATAMMEAIDEKG